MSTSRDPTRAQTSASDSSSSTRPPSHVLRRQSSFGSRNGFPTLQKAQYRPMATVGRRRSVTRASTRASTTEPRGASQRGSLDDDRLSTIDERGSDTDSELGALASDVPKSRYVYQPPSNEFAASEMSIVTKYLEDIRIGQHMSSLTKGLLSDGNLPYNPYPGFVKRLHHLAERFHMFREDEDRIRSILQNQVQRTSTPVLWGVKGHTNVWGLRDIVHMVDPKVIGQYDWLVSTVPPSQLAVVEDSRVKGDILLALTGPAVFSGTFYQDPPSLDFSLEFMLYGSNLDTALRVFSKTLRDDVKRTVSSKYPHHFLGLVLVNGKGVPSLWDRKKIETAKEDFFYALEQSVCLKHPPIMKMIFALDEGRRVFRKGSKKYVFHLIQTDRDTGSEQFTSFSKHAYAALFTSIFLKKAHADAYVAAFRRHHDPAAGGQATARSTGRNGEMSRAETRNQRRGRRGEEPAQKQGAATGLGEEIKEPVRQEWERELARIDVSKGGASSAIYLLLLIILMDRPKYKMEQLVDIYRYLHSTASDFYCAMSMNQILRMFVRQNDNSQQVFATQLFKQYMKDVLTVLNPSLHERSSDHVAAHSFLKNKLQNVLTIQRDEQGSRIKVIPLDVQTIVQLMELDHYCESVQLGLSEDALAHLRHLGIKTLMTSYKEKYPDEDVRPQTQMKTIPEDVKKKGSKSSVHKLPVILKHGVESNSIIQQKNLFMNVEWSVQSSMHPIVMATEGVLMQYLIDVRLDQVWEGYLNDIMTSDHLPPNPYPRLITRLRQAAFKMELWRESDAKLRARLLHGEAHYADRSNHVFVLEEGGAFGVSSALCAVMATSFKKLAVLAEAMVNGEVVSHRGQYQLSSSQAISGHSALYGRMMPYLPYLELHEHYYIRGPIGGDQGAIQLFAKLVYDHIADVCSTDRFAVIGLFVDDKISLDQDQLEEDQNGAEKVIIDAASKKQLIYLKVYYSVGWRYIALHKHYMMHYLYVDHAEDKHRAYFPDDPIYLYQNVFLNLEEAIDHYQQSGVSVRGNPLSASNVGSVNQSIDASIREALKDQDLMRVHRLLMTKALINKNADYLCETWRMLHSVAFQLEYALALIQSLTDLLRYLLQRPDAMATAEYLEEIAAAKAKAKKGTTVPMKKFPISAQILGYMATAFREKLEEVLGEPCCLGPLSLPGLVEDKIRGVVEKHPQTGELSLIIQKQTVLRLNEIRDLLIPVKVAIEYDIHQVCSKVQNTLQHINNHEG